MVVKEEKVEANTSVVEETEEDVRLIGDDGEFSMRSSETWKNSFTFQLPSSLTVMSHVCPSVVSRYVFAVEELYFHCDVILCGKKTLTKEFFSHRNKYVRWFTSSHYFGKKRT